MYLEQDDPQAGLTPVTPLLIKLLLERDAIGKAKYNRSLETFNGRDFLRDVREELLDALQYIVGLDEEWSELHLCLSETEKLLEEIMPLIDGRTLDALILLLSRIRRLLRSSS